MYVYISVINRVNYISMQNNDAMQQTKGESVYCMHTTVYMYCTCTVKLLLVQLNYCLYSTCTCTYCLLKLGFCIACTLRAIFNNFVPLKMILRLLISPQLHL